VARALALLAAFLALPARGQPSPAGQRAPATLSADPVLARLVEESVAARPELRGAEALARAERERVPQAGALPDPTISVGIQNDGFDGIQVGKMETSFYQLMATQPVPWPGKRGLRTGVAELGARQAAASVSRLRLTTEADVHRAYLDLVLARDRLALLTRLQALWQKSAATARTRYEAGQGAQSDVLRAQLELNRLRQRRWALEAEERTSVQVLNRLRAHPLDEPISTIASVRNLAAPALPELQSAVADARERSPELAAARLGADRAAKQVDLARRERWPDFTVSAGIMPRGALDPMWTASVGLSLPIWARRKQGRAVAESEARAESGARDAEAVDQVLALRVEERRTSLEALLQTLRLYREGLLVQSQATADSTLAQYQVGKVGFASVLEANVGYVNDEDAYLKSAADAQRIAIASAEVSLDPVGVASTAAMASPSVPGAGAMPVGGSAPGAAAGAASSANAFSPMPRM
jgi:outer membrane protein TolC